MAIKMVREPSETPNINNIDDIVPMRYAYGNKNGYVIGKGTEISNTVNGLNFTVNSGRLVLQGVECDIDAVGVTITIDNIATKRYYVIYLEVNLGLNTATIKNEYDTATYPSIDAGDDLTANTTGIARLSLYRFTATSGIISDVNKVVESIKYVNEDFIKNVEVNTAKFSLTSSNSMWANYSTLLLGKKVFSDESASSFNITITDEFVKSSNIPLMLVRGVIKSAKMDTNATTTKAYINVLICENETISCPYVDTSSMTVKPMILTRKTNTVTPNPSVGTTKLGETITSGSIFGSDDVTSLYIKEVIALTYGGDFIGTGGNQGGGISP